MRSRALLIILLLASSAQAAIFIAPKDAELIDAADAIVIGTITQMNGEFIAGGDIATTLEIDVTTVLKGPIAPATKIRISELGGTVGSQIMGVSAAPKYWRRNQALIFLERKADGTWRTWGSALGKFDFVNDRFNRDLIVRWANEEDMSLWSPDGHPVDERLRDAQGFLDFIRTRALQQQPQTASGRRRAVSPADPSTIAEGDYFVDDIGMDDVTPPAFWDIEPDQTGFPPSAYSYGSFRWEVFDKGGSITFSASGTQPGYDYLGAAQRGLAAWTNEPGSNINYVYGGTRTLGFVQDGNNAIVFNSSTDVPAGAIAYAKWYGGAYHTYKGEQFISIVEGDVVVKSGLNISQKLFDEAVTHELGHTLGFRHSDQGTPSSNQAVMKAVLSGVYGATLGPWDVDAARTVYESTSTTPAPDAPTGLVATATTTNSITVVWNAVPNATSYQVERSTGNSPFIPVATVNVPSLLDTGLSPNTTYLYRVRVLSSGGSSAYSNVDRATTILFLDDPLTGGVLVKDEHITQLRTAVNAVRASVGLPAYPWAEFVGPGVIVRASHVLELRTALTAALNAFGVPPVYTALSAGTLIRAVHIQELRNYVK